jgi:rhodanese-related sulfurtransferase
MYTEKAPDAVSWFEAIPRASLAMIDELALPLDAPIADVGGGASHLAAELVDRGYTDVTVADISGEALERARDGFAAADRVTWVIADVRAHDFGRRFRLWHDRAVFQFMVAAEDRRAYVATLERSLDPSGDAILATFGPDGPTRCSGLPVARYGPRELAAELGAGLDLVSSREVVHTTPARTAQQFIYARLRRSQPYRGEAASVDGGMSPEARTTVARLLEDARTVLERLQPAAALEAQRQGAALIDIRSEPQRARDGLLPGATTVARNVLEWRLDPACPHRDPELARSDRKVILICDEGYQSSLAAVTLRRFGIDATDVVGGAQAWLAAGLPVERAG